VNPLLIYIGAMAIVGVVGVVAVIIHRGPTRVCPECDASVSLSANTCKWCGYRFVTSTHDRR
jgi:predicted amidophosphoribosyltransferase